MRVIIVESDLVLGAAVESLLAKEADLELIGSTADSEADLIKEIRQAQAEVVILSEFTNLTDPIRLLGLLNNYPQLRVLVVSADENLIQEYDKRRILANQAHDLVNIIHGNKCLG